MSEAMPGPAPAVTSESPAPWPASCTQAQISSLTAPTARALAQGGKWKS
jgi:hypothetical protein